MSKCLDLNNHMPFRIIPSITSIELSNKVAQNRSQTLPEGKVKSNMEQLKVPRRPKKNKNLSIINSCKKIK